MQIVNDNGCSWINDLDPRSNIKVLEKNEECEWLIVGAGYTAVSYTHLTLPTRTRV